MPTSSDPPVSTDRAAASHTGPRSGNIEPIAICGIGLRLPGGVHNGDEFWQLLVEGRDARGKIPPTRFSADGFDASLSGQKAMRTRYGYFLEDDISQFDISFFSMSKKEVEKCDPQQRILLEVVRECLDDAGEVNYRGQPIGCYVGTFGHDWYEMTIKDLYGIGNYSLMGAGDLILANRVSYEFDLRGPRFVFLPPSIIASTADTPQALLSRRAALPRLWLFTTPAELCRPETPREPLCAAPACS